MTPTQPDDLEAEVRGLLPMPSGDSSYAEGVAFYVREARPRVLAALRKQRERAAKQLGEVMDRMADDYTAARVDSTNRITDLKAQLAEAKAERDALQVERNLAWQRLNKIEGGEEVPTREEEATALVDEVMDDIGKIVERNRTLEAALAKVPHLIEYIGWPVLGDAKEAGHKAEYCASFGGQCAFEALAATGAPLCKECGESALTWMHKGYMTCDKEDCGLRHHEFQPKGIK